MIDSARNLSVYLQEFRLLPTSGTLRSFFPLVFRQRSKKYGVGAFELSRPLETCFSQVLWMYIELEDALHWLSTLGGAFSNLGEHSQVPGTVKFVRELIGCL